MGIRGARGRGNVRNGGAGGAEAETRVLNGTGPLGAVAVAVVLVGGRGVEELRRDG